MSWSTHRETELTHCCDLSVACPLRSHVLMTVFPMWRCGIEGNHQVEDSYLQKGLIQFSVGEVFLSQRPVPN